MRSTGLRQACLAGIFAILAGFAVAGCGSGHSGGGGGPGGGTGYATLSWYIFDIEDSTYGYPLYCEDAGAASVVVTLTDQATGAAYPQAAVACSTWAMSTTDVPTGDYAATFELYGDPQIYGNATTLLDSFTATGNFHILAGANDFTQKWYAPFVVQSFTVSWGIYSGTTEISCAAAGAAYVYLDFLVPGATTWVTSRFDCNTGAGTSYAIPPVGVGATVQWSLSLMDATETVAIQTITGVPIALPSTTNVNLTPQYFTF
jgi:hypothetical protein